VSFVTPAIKGNEYTITASGDKNSFAQANFIVPLAKPLPTGQKPDIAEVYSNRGYAHFKKAQWAQVIDSLDAAYAKHASLDRGSWNKQWALDKQQQWDVVIADYNRVTAIIDGAMPQQDSPDANVLKNELELALADYTRAARISKNPAFVNTTGNIMTYIQQWGRDVANINLSPHD
jgi:tetratricopeptide (TPR) repeat protein